MSELLPYMYSEPSFTSDRSPMQNLYAARNGNTRYDPYLASIQSTQEVAVAANLEEQTEVSNPPATITPQDDGRPLRAAYAIQCSAALQQVSNRMVKPPSHSIAHHVTPWCRSKPI